MQQNSESDGRLPHVIGVVVSTRALKRVCVVLLNLERHDFKNASFTLDVVFVIRWVRPKHKALRIGRKTPDVLGTLAPERLRTSIFLHNHHHRQDTGAAAGAETVLRCVAQCGDCSDTQGLPTTERCIPGLVFRHSKPIPLYQGSANARCII